MIFSEFKICNTLDGTTLPYPLGIISFAAQTRYHMIKASSYFHQYNLQ